jgi:hypothetical protein
MFDLFGTNKVDAKESIEAMTKGMTLGLLDAYEYRLQDKDREIERLRNRIEELEHAENKTQAESEDSVD